VVVFNNVDGVVDAVPRTAPNWPILMTLLERTAGLELKQLIENEGGAASTMFTIRRDELPTFADLDSILAAYGGEGHSGTFHQQTDALRAAVKGKKVYCEVGYNVGHSSLTVMREEPNLGELTAPSTVQTVDSSR
jgi:hypothetical protein